MMIRRISIVTLALAAFTALGLVLTAQPEAAEAGQCLPCSLGSPTTTAPVTVGSVDCPWSVMEAKNQLLSLAGCSDGFCVKEFITDVWCSESDPNHLVTMRLRFQCKECIQFPEL